MQKTDLEETIRLLKTTDIPITKLAESLGITSQAFYARLRSAGITARDYKRPSAGLKKFSKETLIELYERQGLTMGEVAALLRTTPFTLSRELKANGIPKRTAYPDLMNMSIGESFEIRIKDRKMPPFVYLRTQAKSKGIKITIRRKDENTVVVTRLPELTFESASAMREKGMDDIAICRYFRCWKTTLAKLFLENKKNGD